MFRRRRNLLHDILINQTTLPVDKKYLSIEKKKKNKFIFRADSHKIKSFLYYYIFSLIF